MKIKKIDRDLPDLDKKYYHDAGIDLRSTEDCVVIPGAIQLIHTGIAVEVPRYHVGLVIIRSSLSLQGVIIANGVGVIDPGYTGEILIPMTYGWLHFGKEAKYPVKRGMRVAQLIVCQLGYNSFNIEIVDELPETNRGDKGFGSTGLY